MADKTRANPVLHLEQNPQTQQQTVELQPDVESCTVLCYVVLALFIYYFANLIRLYLCQRSTQDNDATRPINDAIAIAPFKQARPKCAQSNMEVEEEETAVDDELPSEIPSRKPESGDTDTIRAFPGDSSDLDSTPVTVCRSDLEQCPRQCSVVMTEAGHPRALVEQVTPNHSTDAQRQQPTKKRHVYDQADAALDMETHERELTLPASWTCATTNSAARDKMMEEVNERYPFSLDDEDGDDFMLQQARRTSMTAAQSYLDWQSSTSQCSQDSWSSYEDDLEDAYTARAREAANRLLQNSGMDVFRPEFYSAQLYQGHWGTPASEDFSGEIPAGQLEFYVNNLSHDHGDPDVPDFSTSTHVDMDMSNSESFRPYPFLETILEETAEDLQGESSGSDSGSCSRRSSSSSFWNDDSESGSVIFFPGGKDEAGRGFTEGVEADLDACLAALDAEDQDDEEEEEEREQFSTREVVAELESVKQNGSDRGFVLESSDEDDGDGRVLAEADLTCPRGMGESRSPSVTDSLIQFEALEKELDADDDVQEDPFASLDEHSVEFHTSATSEPFEDSFLATPIGSDFVDTYIEEDCLSRSSTQTMVPGESWKGLANFQRPWTSLAQLENGHQQLSGDSQPRCWRSEGNLWGTHDQDDLRGFLRMRYNQSHKSPVGTSCWEYDKDSLDHEAQFGAREGQDEESEWSDLVHSAKLEQPWTLRTRENPDSTIEPEPWTHSHDSLPGSRSEDDEVDEEEVEGRDPGLSSSEDSESCEEYSDSDHFEPGFAFRSLRSTLHMRSYCSYDSLNLLGHVSTVQTSVFGTNVVPKQLESVEEDATLHTEEDLSLPEADDGESTEEQSQSSSESLDLHPSGDFENPKRKLAYQRSAEALSEDSGYGDSTRHVTPPPLDSSQHIPSSENLVTSTPRRPRPLSLEEAELFLTTENLHSPADITHENDVEKEEDREDAEDERSNGDGSEREVEARSGTHLHSYAMSPPTPPLWLTAWARDANCEGGETEKLMGTREEAEINEENDDEGEVAMVGLPDAKIGLGKEEQMPWHPQHSPSSHPGPAATTLLPPHCATPSTLTVCHYSSRESVVQTSLLPSPSFAREDEVIALSDSESSEDSGPETIMGTPTRVALKRYGARSDVQVYLSKEAKLELEEDPRVTTPIGQTHKGVHFSPVVSAVNWRESYLEEPEDDYEDDSNRDVQRVKVIEEEVAPLSMQKVVLQTTTRPATPVLDKVASLEEDVDVISSKDINPPGKKEFGTVNMSNAKLKKEKEKDKEPLLVRFSLARLSARMSATFQRAASSSSPARAPSPDKEMASKKSKKDKKKEKELKKVEAQQSKSKKPEIPPKPKHLLPSKLSKQDSPLIMAVDGPVVIETAATVPKEAGDAVLNIGEKNEQAPPLHPGNDILDVPEVETPHLLSSNSINSALSALPSDVANTNQSPSQPQSRVLDNYNGSEEKEHTISAKPPIPLPRGLGKPPLPPQTKPRTLYARKAYLDVNNTNNPLPANTNSTEMTLEAALEQFTNSARQDRERLARSVPDLAQVDQLSRENALHHYRVSQVVPIDRTEEMESTPTPKLRSSSSSLVSASDCTSGSSWSSPGVREGSSCHNGTNYAPVRVHGHRAEVLVDQARHKAREAALSRASSVETAWNATLSRTSLSQQLNGIRPEGNSSMVEGFANRCRAQSLGPSGLLETSFDVRSSSSTTDPDAVDSSYRVQEGEVDREEWRETNLDDIIRDLEHLSHSYFYVNRDSASPKAAPHHRRSVVGAGSSSSNSKKARSMYNLGVVDVTINAATNHTNNCTPDQDTNNMDNAGAAGVSGNRGQEWDSNRAKSMEFLLDEDNKQRIQPPENQLQKLGETRQMSEHELRIQRSLQRLNVPDWYKKYAPRASNQGDEVDGTPSTPSTGILRRREFGSATFNPGASTRSTGGWSGFQRDSKTASMTSLGSRSTTPTRVVIPTRGRTPDWRYVKSSRESLVSPVSTMSSNLASPVPHDANQSMNHSSLFNWSSGSAVAGQHPRWGSTRMSVSSGTASPGSTSTYRSSLLTSRTPYLGWRSQEKLNAMESSTGYLTASERLANSIRTPSTSALATPMSSPAPRSPSRHREPQSEEAPDDVRTSIREVTSAIVHYVTESTSPQPNGRMDHTPQPSSPFPQETYQHLASSRSPSPRRQRCVWVESSFLGTPPPVARPLASPPSSSTPSPLPTFGAGRRTTDSAIDYGRAVVHRDVPFPAMVPVPAVHREVPLPTRPPPVTSPTMEDVINSLLGLPSPHCTLRRPTSQPVFNRNFSSANGHESIRNEKSFSDLRSAASNGSPGQFQSS